MSAEAPPVPDVPDDEQLDAPPPRRLRQRLLLGTLGLLLAVSLLGIPVLRIVQSDDERTGNRSGLATENTALLFSNAVLERRSISRAMQVARPELRAQVDELIGELQLRDASDLAGAASALSEVRCEHTWPPGSVCYEAALAQPGRPPILAIRFAISDVQGLAIVVALSRMDQLIAMVHGSNARLAPSRHDVGRQRTWRRIVEFVRDAAGRRS